MINKDKKDRVVRQFVTYCRMALRYEKINYYNERKRMAERESHMEMFSEKQLETVDKIFDTYHADYFYVMGYEIGIVDGDLAQALRELSDRQLQIVLMYYFIGWTDREIGGILGLEKAVNGDYFAMQEVIRLFKPYMARLSIEEGRFNRELYERLVRKVMLITVRIKTDYDEK